MRPYIVRQGDYLAKIAAQVGCGEDEIWDHAKNRDLRAQGRTKDILCAGDVLFVPSKPSEPRDLTIGGSNQYKGNVALVSVAVRFRRGGKPIAGARYVVTGAGDRVEGSSEGDGLVKFEVPTHVSSVTVTFPDQRLSYRVSVGHVDPSSEASGQRGRLRQLGYLPAAPDGSAIPDEVMAAAVRAFQHDQGLAESGQVDDDTRGALEKAFGC